MTNSKSIGIVLAGLVVVAIVVVVVWTMLRRKEKFYDVDGDGYEGLVGDMVNNALNVKDRCTTGWGPGTVDGKVKIDKDKVYVEYTPPNLERVTSKVTKGQMYYGTPDKPDFETPVDIRTLKTGDNVKVEFSISCLERPKYTLHRIFIQTPTPGPHPVYGFPCGKGPSTVNGKISKVDQGRVYVKYDTPDGSVTSEVTKNHVYMDPPDKPAYAAPPQVLRALVVDQPVEVVFFAPCSNLPDYPNYHLDRIFIQTPGPTPVARGDPCGWGPSTVNGKISKVDQGRVYVKYDTPDGSVTSEVTKNHVYIEYDPPRKPNYDAAPQVLRTLDVGQPVQVVFFAPCSRLPDFPNYHLYRIFVKQTRPLPKPTNLPTPITASSMFRCTTRVSKTPAYSCTKLPSKTPGQILLHCTEPRLVSGNNLA